MKILRFKKTAVALAAGTLIAVAGSATASVTVPGVTPPATAPFSAYTKAPIAFTVDPPGPPTPIIMSCGSAVAAGRITPKTTAGGLAAGVIHGTAWGNCVGLGIDLNVAHTVGSKWTLNAVTPNAGNNIWTGTVTGISAHVYSKNPAIPCDFDVTGTAAATFTEAQVAGNNNFTQTLDVNQPANGALTISNVVGCFGQLSNTWPASFQTGAGGYKVYNSSGLVDIQP